MFVMPNGMLKSNQQLVDIIEKVKPEIRLLIEKCNTVGVGLSTLHTGLDRDQPPDTAVRIPAPECGSVRTHDKEWTGPPSYL